MKETEFRLDGLLTRISENLNLSIVNAIDSDWYIDQKVLSEHGIEIEFLCVC
jgi:hypothetical protein